MRGLDLVYGQFRAVQALWRGKTCRVCAVQGRMEVGWLVQEEGAATSLSSAWTRTQTRTRTPRIFSRNALTRHSGEFVLNFLRSF